MMVATSVAAVATTLFYKLQRCQCGCRLKMGSCHLNRKSKHEVKLLVAGLAPYTIERYFIKGVL